MWDTFTRDKAREYSDSLTRSLNLLRSSYRRLKTGATTESRKSYLSEKDEQTSHFISHAERWPQDSSHIFKDPYGSSVHHRNSFFDGRRFNAFLLDSQQRQSTHIKSLIILESIEEPKRMYHL